MTATTWMPPDDPNPSEILHSAVADTRSGIHEVALAKFLWFHHNARRYQRGISAVRRSFALSYWLDLATKYPPAREAFQRTRDEAEAAFREDPADFDLFQDVAALNRKLGEGIRTADLFVQVAESDHATAAWLYHVAERYLIASGRYHACGPFLDPQRRMERQAEAYRMQRRHEEARPSGPIPIPKLARLHYVDDVATLVTLLVLNTRVEDARDAYRVALEVVDDAEFRTILEAALTGHFPARRTG